MFFRKKRLAPESFKLELPNFEKIKPVNLDELGKTEIPKKTKISKTKKFEVLEFKKPELKIEVKPKKDKSLLKLKKLDKGYKNDLVDLKSKSKEHERGFKLISEHIKEQASRVGEIDKNLDSFSKEFKNLKGNIVTVSTFDSFSIKIRNRLESLDKIDKEISKKLALIKEIKGKIDEKYSLNLQITNQMKERILELKKDNQGNTQIVQDNLNKMMVFMKDLSTAFNNSVSIRGEIKRRLIEHDKKIRELISISEKPLDIEEYLRMAEGEK